MIHLRSKQVIVALDFDSYDQAMSVCNNLDPEKFRLKVGKQLYSAEGPKILDRFHQLGFEVFLDLKFHDIPNTVYKALKNVFALGVWMTNIHLLGGTEMIQAAKEAQLASDKENLLIGVTVLTSLKDSHLKEIGITKDTNSLVSELSLLAKKASLDGVVCSVHEVRKLKKNFGLDFLTVTPGIRIQQEKGDQTRVASLEMAIEENTDYIVLGREISQAENISKMINKLESYII
tara:strand:- start:222 stop:920 length:699 start_codon:yes stop_codon:yes gene_type:complete